jgi:hypothetical protein
MHGDALFKCKRVKTVAFRGTIEDLKLFFTQFMLYRMTYKLVKMSMTLPPLGPQGKGKSETCMGSPPTRFPFFLD